MPASLPHMTRYFAFISAVPATKQTVGRLASLVRLAAKKPAKAAAGAGSDPAAVKRPAAIAEDGTPGSMPELPDAEMGKVMTRFPPEASGYLHIGHVKAAMLNAYYAKKYNGKLLLRFDDTNPSKEKEEFEESIIRDLDRLGIHADVCSHTSDHFATILDYARKMIRDGNAFMDDADQEKMRDERMKRINSANRDRPAEENLALFERLCQGDPEVTHYCLRAKINMQSDNGTLRDPVMVRFIDLPHSRTGDKCVLREGGRRAGGRDRHPPSNGFGSHPSSLPTS